MTQIRALRGGAVGHRNRNSRLIILGGMMAMLYFLFMTLSFNVMGGATQHQQPKAPPRPPPAHRPGIGGGISFGCPGRLLNERGYHRTGELPTSNYNNINGGLYLDNVGTLPRGALCARRG